MSYLRVLLLALLTVVFVTSCVPRRKMVYLQAAEDQVNDTSKVYGYQKTDYRLQENDIIDVKIVSLVPEVNEMFNGSTTQSQQAAQAGVQSGGDLYYMTGYSINGEGVINLPVVGAVQVEGMTIAEAKLSIDKKVQQYFSKYYLTVKLGGLRYSALGEFNRPGKYVILQNQATIFEAIANAGDLNMVASRDDIKLIRQYPDGTRIHEINLLDQSIVSSPYYFIQPNDVIYVEPLKQKSYGLGVTGAQTLTTVISVVSTSLALILAIQGLNN